MNTAIMNLMKRKTALLLFLMLLAVILIPAGDQTHASGEVVRVGWFESSFNSTDQLGRRSGYAYDYQQKIAAYSGWTYEYVEGSWSELLQMLTEGRIDLLADVSYTEERTEKMLFSAVPMGAEDYYLFIDPENHTISSEDYSTFNGKKVGANKGSVQIKIFQEWSKANGVQAQVVELTGTAQENLTRLLDGEIDMYLSLDSIFEKDFAVPVCKIGSSDFYFAVSKSRPDLLVELNNAMNRVLDENSSYDHMLHAKYLEPSGISHYLSAEENDWLSDHGPIRVGYQDNYLAFCAEDPKTGELTGALKDYLMVASDCLENAHLEFEPVCYPSSAAAMDALKNGEVDCAFPANFTNYDGEQRGVFMTPAIMCTDMSAVIREEDKDSFARNDRVTVAVNAGNPNYDMFLLDHFPEWRVIYYADTQECLRAIADRNADCLLISNYRYNNIAALCEQLGLTTWSTGVEMDYCFAVNRGDTILYSVLAKVAGAVPESTSDAALAYHFADDARITFLEVLKKYYIVAAVVLVVILALAFLLVRSVRKNKKIRMSQEQTPETRDFSLFDDLPISYSIYHVTHSEHSQLYDAAIIYVNHKYEEYGGLPASAVLGHSVRELYPHITEDWFQDVRKAAQDGETVERDFVDAPSGRHFYFAARPVGSPGYCSITYMEK